VSRAKTIDNHTSGNVEGVRLSTVRCCRWRTDGGHRRGGPAASRSGRYDLQSGFLAASPRGPLARPRAGARRIARGLTRDECSWQGLAQNRKMLAKFRGANYRAGRYRFSSGSICGGPAKAADSPRRVPPHTRGWRRMNVTGIRRLRKFFMRRGKCRGLARNRRWDDAYAQGRPARIGARCSRCLMHWRLSLRA